MEKLDSILPQFLMNVDYESLSIICMYEYFINDEAFNNKTFMTTLNSMFELVRSNIQNWISLEVQCMEQKSPFCYPPYFLLGKRYLNHIKTNVTR